MDCWTVLLPFGAHKQQIAQRKLAEQFTRQPTDRLIMKAWKSQLAEQLLLDPFLPSVRWTPMTMTTMMIVYITFRGCWTERVAQSAQVYLSTSWSPYCTLLQ